MNRRSEVLPQQGREFPDPVEQRNPIPWPVLGLLVVMLAIGIAYIATANIETPSTWGDGRQRDELRGSQQARSGAVDGAAVFASLCVACHQSSGQGLAGVFPPLAGSEWVQGKDGTVAAIVLYGINGTVTVKGTTYNGAMPPFKDQLNDAQVAAVLTYVRSQWGNSGPPITVEIVALAREAHRDRTSPFAGDKELPPHD